MNKKFNAKQLTLLGLMTALLLLMSFTPLGYLNIGPLAITFNVIPVAVSALALGPVGGLIAGSVFGLTSFLQAIGVGGVSMLGSTLFSINPFFSILLCFVPRMLDGFLLGYIFRSVRKLNRVAACFVTGFAAAFLNTLFFMSALILLFGQTEYMQGLINGQNILLFVCAFVGVNAVFEMLSSTVITGAVGSVLLKAGFIQTPAKKQIKRRSSHDLSHRYRQHQHCHRLLCRWTGHFPRTRLHKPHRNGARICRHAQNGV
ncbi:ECF transporter S component [Hominenteromicrobium sp.]|uniref:ECF transporter S component n=1 Tax=Hominenteromicrobium sp. TaxID=3073581 RepID=UPI0039952308